MRFRMRDAIMRFGYEAFFWSFVRRIMEPRFVTVETEMMADWKWVRIQSELEKRAWK